MPAASADDRERWRCRRARHHADHPGRGGTPGSLDALERWRALTLVCATPGCAALVDRGAAHRAAIKAHRSIHVDGDGCAGPRCSSDFRPARFAKRQRKMADDLEKGARTLAGWPSTVSDLAVILFPDSALRAATAARAALADLRGADGRGDERE